MLRALLLSTVVVSANAATFWSDQCDICWPGNRGKQCGANSPTGAERGCGFLNWGCEYQCNGIPDQRTQFWTGGQHDCINWMGAGDRACGNAQRIGSDSFWAGWSGLKCNYKCERSCPNTQCAPGHTRNGWCGNRNNNYWCSAIPGFVSAGAGAPASLQKQPPSREEWDSIGVAVPAAVASVVGDPHLALPHGGIADFRGADKTFYNFLSAKNLSLNVMTELADFELHPSNSSRHKSVHGSFLTQVHAVARSTTGKVVRVSFYADKIGQGNIAWANGTVDDEPTFALGAKKSKTVDDVSLKMTYASLIVTTPEFEITVTPRKFRLERNIVGLHHRLDVQLKLRVPESSMAVAPHGIIGQAWDGDGKSIDGERDLFPDSGEFTTYAMAKGAIEGSPNDYKMATKYATDFKYSRFDLKAAAPRDVTKLVAAGLLSTPKAGKSTEFVGSTEYDFDKTLVEEK